MSIHVVNGENRPHPLEMHIGEDDCLIYQVVCEPGVELRTRPTVNDDARTGAPHLELGDIVAVDYIKPSDDPANGPYLRLADGSGWLFQKKMNFELMQPVPIESGLWTFYVDNPPNGQPVRNQPIDRKALRKRKSNGVDVIMLKPMQKVYCDRQVRHPRTGVVYYRLQGNEGWIMDRRITKEGQPDHVMLLNEDQISRGLFAYQTLHPIAIRAWSTAGEDARTGDSIPEGQIVAVDIVRHSPHGKGNGPFLHLADGSGWIFVRKREQVVMEAIPVTKGEWTVRVLNAPYGIQLRRHPTDSDLTLDTLLPSNQRVDCDRCVSVAATGVNYYRVAGTTGWIFDRRENIPMLEVLSKGPLVWKASDNPNPKESWSLDFVRGIASTVDEVEEIVTDEGGLLAFRHMSDGCRINVYFCTRTVGISLDGRSSTGKVPSTTAPSSSLQLFRTECTGAELRAILVQPRTYTGRGYHKRKRQESEHPVVIPTPMGKGYLLEDEHEIRNELVQNDKEMKMCKQRRVKLLQQIAFYDEASRKVADSLWEETQKLRAT